LGGVGKGISIVDLRLLSENSSPQAATIANPSTMNYRQIRPSAAVGRYVEFYWILEDRVAASGVQRIVPDGRSGLILNFASPFESHSNGAWRRQPECFFIGQITGPLLLRPSGPAGMLGVQFRPHGAAQLLGMPIDELTDSAIALEDLSRRLFRELERLRELPSLLEAVAALDPILRALADRSRVDHSSVSHVVTEIERTDGLISVKRAADRIGWSTRQLQRRFKEAVGISPKLFGRMLRFQGVLRAIDDPASDWVDAAIRCGYYDQAHLIRDCREFSGKTPTALLDPEIDLSRHFVQRMSHFSNTTRGQSR
jgi:AraC-like DNA-binding protein